MRFPPALEQETYRLLRIRPNDHIVFPADEYKHGRVVIYRDNLAKTLHRYLWERAFGTLPFNVFLRRTCSEPRCVNPNHYEKTQRTRPLPEQCRNGHRYTKGNTRVDGRGVRHCIRCEVDRRKRKQGESFRASGLCRKGLHKMTEGNIYITLDAAGVEHRRCAACKRQYERERRAA